MPKSARSPDRYDAVPARPAAKPVLRHRPRASPTTTGSAITTACSQGTGRGLPVGQLRAAATTVCKVRTAPQRGWRRAGILEDFRYARRTLRLRAGGIEM